MFNMVCSFFFALWLVLSKGDTLTEHIHYDEENDALFRMYDMISKYQLEYAASNGDIELQIPSNEVEEVVRLFMVEHKLIQNHGLKSGTRLLQNGFMSDLMQFFGVSGNQNISYQVGRHLFVGDMIWVRKVNSSNAEQTTHGEYATITGFLNDGNKEYAISTLHYDNDFQKDVYLQVFHVNRDYSRFRVLQEGSRDRIVAPYFHPIGVVLKSIAAEATNCAIIELYPSTIIHSRFYDYHNDKPSYMSSVAHPTPTTDDVYCFHTFAQFSGKITHVDEAYTYIHVDDEKVPKRRGMCGTYCVNWESGQHYQLIRWSGSTIYATSLLDCVDSVQKEYNKIFIEKAAIPPDSVSDMFVSVQTAKKKDEL